MANSKIMKILGYSETTIEIEGLKIPINFKVAGASILIEVDFLYKNNTILDFSRNIMIMKYNNQIIEKQFIRKR